MRPTFEEAFEQAEVNASTEIYAAFARGFAGEKVQLPDAYLDKNGNWVRMNSNFSFTRMVSGLCDDEVAIGYLMQACKAHRCGHNPGPLLNQFMHACAQAYCDEHATDLAKAARDDEISHAWENGNNYE